MKLSQCLRLRNSASAVSSVIVRLLRTTPSIRVGGSDAIPGAHPTQPTPTTHDRRPPQPPRIAIVGAGLGGLTLAAVLHRHGLPATVYELDAGPRARGNQGGNLDIHPSSGQWALAQAGLLPAFHKLVLPGGESTRVLDRTGKVHWDETGAAPAAEDGKLGERPEVDRTALRDLLLGSLPDGAVQWGAKVAAIAPRGAGAGAAHHVIFSDGHAPAAADVVVGADGAWSRVRRALSPAVPEYYGLSVVEAYLSDVDTKHPHLAKLVGSGSMMALDDGKGLIAQRNANGRIRTYVVLTVPAGWAAEHAAACRDDVPGTLAMLLRHFDGWAPELTALLLPSESFVARGIFQLPVGHCWPRVPGVTLLGDAAHLTAPSGEGANLAMQDGAELALALAARPGDVEGALAAYEATMIPRAAEEARVARGMFRSMFVPGSIDALVKMFQGGPHI